MADLSRRSFWLFAASLGLITLFSLSCRNSAIRPGEISTWILPPQTHEIATNSSIEGAMTVSTWEFDPGMPWNAYAAWLRSRVPASYQLTHESAGSLVAARFQSGDAWYVSIEQVRATPLRVRATLQVSPD